jgi:hypothetical protein
MFMQTVNRSDTERVWVNFTNSDGLTITAHYPVVKILGNTASISTNEAATKAATFGYAGLGGGNIIGLAYEDVANNDVGIAQVYGYHESALIAPLAAAVTIRPGYGMTYDLTTLGLNSVGADFNGPIVALDTIGGGATSGNGSLLSANIATAGQAYADHVFIRAM